VWERPAESFHWLTGRHGNPGRSYKSCAGNLLNRDDVIDPLRELAGVLHDVGLEPTSGGCKVTFAGRDPIIGSLCRSPQWQPLR
jgi:hypothetical protein